MQGNETYTFAQSANIVTLSTNGASLEAPPQGIIYVPRLANTSQCIDMSAPFVPTNVTTLSDFPSNFDAIALFPWVSANCTAEYLAAANNQQNLGVITYLPNAGVGPPPGSSDPAWNMANSQWKNSYLFPIYAVPSSVGQQWVQEASLYSGNITSAPNGAQLSSQYGETSTPRLFTLINLSITSGLPSLWIFLVVILAILVIIVGVISTALHVLQRVRRRSLRRRIQNGEVQLETLGVKRLTVPQEVLAKMPVYTYDKTGGASASDSSPATSPQRSTADDAARTEKVTPLPRDPTLSAYDQPTCAICLDDFAPGESQVRELPCQHIFHPDCVDPFLTQSSSLCPLCKKSSLPKGYCPEVITNLMVRRERIVRREQLEAEYGTTAPSTRTQAWLRKWRIRRLPRRDIEMAVTRNRRVPHPTQSTPTQDQLRQRIAQGQARRASPQREGVEGASSSPPPTERESRRQWARRRAEAMVGTEAVPANTEEGAAPRPAWRRALGRAFPTLG